MNGKWREEKIKCSVREKISEVVGMRRRRGKANKVKNEGKNTTQQNNHQLNLSINY